MWRHHGAGCLSMKRGYIYNISTRTPAQRPLNWSHSHLNSAPGSLPTPLNAAAAAVSDQPPASLLVVTLIILTT